MYKVRVNPRAETSDAPMPTWTVALRFAEDVPVDAQDPRRLVLHPVVVPLLRHPKGASLGTTARSPGSSWDPLKNLGNPCTFGVSIAHTKNLVNRSTFAIS